MNRDTRSPVDYARSFTHERPQPETDQPTERVVSADRITQSDWLDLKNHIAFLLRGDYRYGAAFTEKQLNMMDRAINVMMGLDLTEELQSGEDESIST